MVAGAVQSVICGPIELVKTHCQVSGVGQKNKKPKSEIQVAKEIVKRDGFLGLSRGLGLTVCREVPSFGAYFFCYHIFYTNGIEKFPEHQFKVMMFAGGMAGVGCWSVSYPTDVLKTRWQADGVAGKKIYSNLGDCWKATSLEGPIFHPRSTFWRGFGATAVRAFPVNAITFTVVNVMATNLMAIKMAYDELR